MFTAKPMKDPKGYLTDEECERLLSHSDGKDKLLIFTLLKTGRRISEVVGKNGVTLNDINEQDSIVRWRIVKRGRRKIILENGNEIKYSKEKETELKEKGISFTFRKPEPLPITIPTNPGVIAAIVAYAKAKNKHPNEPIFEFTRQRAHQIIRKVGKSAGIMYVGERKIHPHHLRHTFAMQKAKGLKYMSELTMLKDLLAHVNIENTSQYLSYFDEQMKKMVEK